MAPEAPPPKLVLIVDDDQDIQDILSFAVKKAGLRAETARDGIAAVSKIPILKPDLIVLDLMLPVISGLDILDQLQSAGTSVVPVIVITGASAMSGLKEKVQRYSNVVAFLEKPIKMSALTDAVLNALAPRSPGT